MLQTKSNEFCYRFYVDIDESLFRIYRKNVIFVLLKNDVTSILFWYVCKLKSQIYTIIIDFVIWIKFQIFEKIKRIRDDDELKSFAFDI